MHARLLSTRTTRLPGLLRPRLLPAGRPGLTSTACAARPTSLGTALLATLETSLLTTQLPGALRPSLLLRELLLRPRLLTTVRPGLLPTRTTRLPGLLRTSPLTALRARLLPRGLLPTVRITRQTLPTGQLTTWPARLLLRQLLLCPRLPRTVCTTRQTTLGPSLRSAHLPGTLSTSLPPTDCTGRLTALSTSLLLRELLLRPGLLFTLRSSFPTAVGTDPLTSWGAGLRTTRLSGLQATWGASLRTTRLRELLLRPRLLFTLLTAVGTGRLTAVGTGQLITSGARLHTARLPSLLPTLCASRLTAERGCLLRQLLLRPRLLLTSLRPVVLRPGLLLIRIHLLPGG